ncbi:restriction endonuclease subunit S [Pseudomonas sp.]|uniref:restriction endonuclease subunit S n=1 Tax=Pseudomonas sp. TaxID=306 RepID=UPI0027315F57|nr:restriction endonuclease subunit S [Pseudomonas sp.]MDP2245705.1 restriction endonuclease subunit S [Pseudomonas sp.]
MSHYKPYSAYKDSGVQWLGRVPEHWQVKRLKFIATVQTGIAKGKDNVGKDTIEVPYLRVANVQDGYLSLDDVTTIEIPREDLPRYSLRPGDVLMNEGGDFDKLGRGHVWQGEIAPCIHQNHVFAVRPAKVPSYWLNAFSGSQPAQFYFMGRSKQSTNLASISSSNVMELPVVVPPDDELPAVLAHLDRETARIDALIEKKTRFIELLREKRQALITHAVTKGLDPNVKMKDSGVEWLGEVPEHWEALPLRRVVSAVKTGGTPSEELPAPDADGLAWYTPGDFGSSLVLTSSEKRVSALAVSTGEAKVYPAGSVLVVSIGATLGKVGYIVDPASANQQINAVIPSSRVNGYFLAYSLSVKTEAMWFLANAATIGIMNQEKTKEIWLAVPSPSEQKAITEYLDKDTGRLDSLIGKTELSIGLLKERRSALITAAVTGQIDLREAV